MVHAHVAQALPPPVVLASRQPRGRLLGSRRAWSCNLRLILGGRSRLANRQARICSLLARGHGPGSGSGRCALHGRRLRLNSGRALVRGCGSAL